MILERCCQELVSKFAICTCSPKVYEHCTWPTNFEFPNEQQTTFYSATSLIPYSATVEYGDVFILITPRAWLPSSVINALLHLFNTSTMDSVHFVDVQIMVHWIQAVEELCNFRSNDVDLLDCRKFLHIKI